MDRKQFSKWIDNTVQKGKIACNRQFLLFQCIFKKTFNGRRENQGLFGKGLNASKLDQSIVEKSENTGYQHYLFFPQHFKKKLFSSVA